MIKFRRYRWVYGLLCVELIYFLMIYCVGANGIRAVRHAQNANSIQEQEVTQLKDEVENLKKELHQWETEPFYKEKEAREHLQMARPGDLIYYT